MDSTKVVRGRPREAGVCAVRHPETGAHIVPVPGEAYAANDPLVRAYPWLFVAEGEEDPDPPRVTEVKIETAMRRPVGRPRKAGRQ